MSVQLVVVLVSFGVALLIAGLGYLVGKFVDRSRGVRPDGHTGQPTRIVR